jgi:hypothetical protein
MARRKQPPAGMNGDAHPKSAAERAAANGAKEGQGQIPDAKEGQEGAPPPKWFTERNRRRHEVWANNPLQDELDRQKIRLRESSCEMEWGLAQAIVEALRATQEHQAEDFATFVALVKPRGATRVPARVSPKALASLVEDRSDLMNDDGSVNENYAKVLDAAYVEVAGGAALRDPVAYPSREWMEKYSPIDRKVQSELERIDRLAATGAAEERRRMRGQGDDGPAS